MNRRSHAVFRFARQRARLEQPLRRARRSTHEHREAAIEGDALVVDRNMWGADEFRDGYIKNLFDRLDALILAFDGAK